MDINIVFPDIVSNIGKDFAVVSAMNPIVPDCGFAVTRSEYAEIGSTVMQAC